jgi:hypothetical protein
VYLTEEMSSIVARGIQSRSQYLCPGHLPSGVASVPVLLCAQVSEGRGPLLALMNIETSGNDAPVTQIYKFVVIN